MSSSQLINMVLFSNLYKNFFLSSHQNLGLSGKRLTPYQTIPGFNNPERASLLYTMWEKEKMLLTSIPVIPPTLFSTLTKTK